jgi:TolB protein
MFCSALYTSASAQTNDCKTILSVAGKELAYPRFSKDNNIVLYQSNESGKWQICMTNLATGKQRLLSDGKYNDNFPDWNASNDRIAFVSDRDGNEEIYVLDIKIGKLERLTSDAARDIHPYFSPDGKYLLFNSTRGNGSLDVYRYTFSNKKTERLTATAEHETCARYSPDMKKIVFLRNDDAEDDVYLMDTKTLKETNLTQTPHQRDGWPVFDNMGTWIYFSTMRSGSFAIYRATLKGNKLQQLTFPSVGEEDARAFVSSDGRTLLYNKRKGSDIDIRQCTLSS